ncbi:hypothetical protein NCCP133_28500 [Cytobacillus sp. NCCP-133]|nr:hypothetical protein NCCP133_28500 [Cytobacillus sp. NCCP-133]
MKNWELKSIWMQPELKTKGIAFSVSDQELKGIIPFLKDKGIEARESLVSSNGCPQPRSIFTTRMTTHWNILLFYRGNQDVNLNRWICEWEKV